MSENTPAPVAADDVEAHFASRFAQVGDGERTDTGEDVEAHRFNQLWDATGEKQDETQA